MPPAILLMVRKPTITIVGLGRLGSTLARELKRHRYRVREIRRGSRTVPQHTEIVWFCVPDGAIARAAREFARGRDWKGKIALHASGALASDELEPLRKRGASVASVHPLMTFVRGAKPSLNSVPFALEGDPVALRQARQIVRALGGVAFDLTKEMKPAYHAWGTFLSPLVVALLVTAEQVAAKAGIASKDARKKMLPIVRQTIENYAALGPAAAFSGPIVRGDAAIVRRHLQVLRGIPEARQVYLALAQSALRRLPTADRKALQRALK